MKKHITTSCQQTQKLGGDLAKKILNIPIAKTAVVLGLSGNLGGGKTTFLQGFAKGLGVKEKILSPTFVILKRFKIPQKITRYQLPITRYQNFYHIDCYRLDNPVQELIHLGFKKILADPHAIVVVEWADRIKKILPKDTLWISLFHGKRGLTQRCIEYNAT